MNKELNKIIDNMTKESMQDLLKWIANTQSEEVKENMLKYFKNNEKSDLIFIKNIVSVDVDGLKGINHYTIKAQYNKIDNEGYATLVHKLIDEFDYTWDEIEQEGGIAEINKQLKECYNVEI
jgi:hypothetical protein